jgi:hypothetical protein
MCLSFPQTKGAGTQRVKNAIVRNAGRAKENPRCRRDVADFRDCFYPTPIGQVDVEDKEIWLEAGAPCNCRLNVFGFSNYAVAGLTL